MVKIAAFIFLIGGLAACSSVVNTAANEVTSNLSSAILNQNDPETVRDGAPAYLLLVDSLIEVAPDDIPRLIAGAKLYSAYAGVFVENKQRARRMAEKAHVYAAHALYLKNKLLGESYSKSFDAFEQAIKSASKADVEALYILGASWATLMQTSSSNWSSMADLPKIRLLMQRILELQDDYENGNVHLYLAVFDSQLPPSMGGKPEQARRHFEQAIKLSDGKNLMAKVLYARHYARLLYNRELHDKLLTEVLSAPTESPGYTLMNTLAKQEATALLESANEYF
jgi:tetratricopeptide (TPR) repeat protein